MEIYFWMFKLFFSDFYDDFASKLQIIKDGRMSYYAKFPGIVLTFTKTYLILNRTINDLIFDVMLVVILF